MSKHVNVISETRQGLLDANRKFISDSTKEINDQLSTLKPISSEKEYTTVFDQCDKKLADIKENIEKIKRQFPG